MHLMRASLERVLPSNKCHPLRTKTEISAPEAYSSKYVIFYIQLLSINALLSFKKIYVYLGQRKRNIENRTKVVK